MDGRYSSHKLFVYLLRTDIVDYKYTPKYLTYESST